jgi:hypothetical protein
MSSFKSFKLQASSFKLGSLRIRQPHAALPVPLPLPIVNATLSPRALSLPFSLPASVSVGRHGLHILRNPTSVHGNEFRPASSILSILHSSNCIILVSCSFRASVSLHPVAAEVGSAGHRIDRHIHTIEYMNLARTTVDSTLEVH